MSWSEHKLGEFISIKHGWAFKGEFFAEDGRYLLLTPGNAYEAGGLKLRPGKEKFYTGEFPDEFLLKSGDMLVVMTDLVQAAPILGGAIVIPEDDRFLHNQRLGLVEHLPDTEIDRTFLYYVLNSPAYRGQVRGSATGATVRHSAPKRICDCSILVPDSLGEQKQIGSVLLAYDNLIATNQRRIALLEDAARSLYREWFVYLRFPGYETVEVVDGVPVGWRRLTLGELADESEGAVVQTGPFGSQLHSHEYTESGIPVIMPQDIVGDRVRMNKIAFVDESTALRLSRHTLEPLDIVFPRRGDISKRAIIEEHQGGFLCGTGCLKISFPEVPLHPILLYHQLAEPDMVKWIEGQAVGATMLNLSATILRSVECFIPAGDVQDAFVNFANKSRNQINALEMQNEALVKARDALLPKLMSGQLDVSGIALPELDAA